MWWLRTNWYVLRQECAVASTDGLLAGRWGVVFWGWPIGGAKPMTKQQVAEWVREARTRDISEHQDAMRFADNQRFVREVMVLADQYETPVPAELREVC